MTKFEEKLEKLPIKTIQHPVGDTKYYTAVHVKTLIAQADEEIVNLKSQLQQQALPVVPECVDLFIKECRKFNYDLDQAFYEQEDGSEATENNKCILWRRNHPDEFARAWLDGYTVEKPQLFYLKHIDMSKRNSINDLYLKKYIHAALTGTGEHRLAHAMSAKGTYPSKDYCAFTQQEIDSMETGSYELVPVEDNQ